MTKFEPDTTKIEYIHESNDGKPPDNDGWALFSEEINWYGDTCVVTMRGPWDVDEPCDNPSDGR